MKREYKPSKLSSALFILGITRLPVQETAITSSSGTSLLKSQISSRFAGRFRVSGSTAPVQIAVTVKLQKNGRMIGRPSGYSWPHAVEPKFAKVQRLNKRIDDAKRIALVNQLL